MNNIIDNIEKFDTPLLKWIGGKSQIINEIIYIIFNLLNLQHFYFNVLIS